MYKVSIGIPIYNVATCLSESLLSALNQTFESIEYILVDDCGVDDSMLIAHKIIESHSRRSDVRVIKHEKNRGLGEARNTVISNANAEYVYFLDSDDVMTEDCISLLYSAVFKSNADFSTAFYSKIDEYGCAYSSKSIYRSPDTIEVTDKKAVFMAYTEQNLIYGTSWNKLYRLSFLKDNSVRNKHRTSEDLFFQMQEFAYASKIVIVPCITYFYVMRSNSITCAGNINRNFIENRIVVVQDSFQFILSISDKRTQFLSFFLLFFHINYFSMDICRNDFLNNSDKRKYIKILYPSSIMLYLPITAIRKECLYKTKALKLFSSFLIISSLFRFEYINLVTRFLGLRLRRPTSKYSPSGKAIGGLRKLLYLFFSDTSK